MTSKIEIEKNSRFAIRFFLKRFSSSTCSLVMLVVHNLDHMMQPHEWETLLTREIHGARVSSLILTEKISFGLRFSVLLSFENNRHRVHGEKAN